jgi:pyruvate formate lyase activating enzyme
MKGRIHSVETMGLLDGPGVRVVIFFQGCKLRCAYCHNPDTWDLSGGEEMEAEQLVNKVLRYKSYFNKSGGVTCSGGEPLMQPEFLEEFMRLCKKNGIHTVLDTAGFGIGNYNKILEYTDLVILDIKHCDEKGYRELTGGAFSEFEKFKSAITKNKNKIWIRHVVVPGITDGEIHQNKIKDMIKEFTYVDKVEFLPYHTLGVHKYHELNIPMRIKEIRNLENGCKKFEIR